MNTQNTRYDVDYFIAKFEAIPEKAWKTGCAGERGDDRHCALGHCGVYDEDSWRDEDLSEEAKVLANILSVVNPPNDSCSLPLARVIFEINDRGDENPRGNILAALRKVKAQQ